MDVRCTELCDISMMTQAMSLVEAKIKCFSFNALGAYIYASL